MHIMPIRFYYQYLFVQVGFNKDGKLQALDITMHCNDGYVSEWGWSVSTVIIFLDICLKNCFYARFVIRP